MRVYKDVFKRDIRLSDERYEHFVTDHPEMDGQIDKVQESLFNPAKVVQSKTDSKVDLFYRHYPSTPVSQKYHCVVVKVHIDNAFIITAYFTDTMKRGTVLWKKK